MDTTPDRSRDEPDHTKDPRDQGTGQGYPESEHAEATPHEGTDEGPEAGTEDVGAPSPSTGGEADRDQSTGNPHAAG